MVERENREITIKRQAELLGIHRTTVYRQREPRQETPVNVKLMHEIDRLYTKHPYFGYRRMTVKLQEQGWTVYGATRCQDSYFKILRCEKMHKVCSIVPLPPLGKALELEILGLRHPA